MLTSAYAAIAIPTASLAKKEEGGQMTSISEYFS